MTDAPKTPPAGLPSVETLAGTDARPADEQGGAPPAAEADAQGGENEQQDALRAHARAQGSAGAATGGLDDTRASGQDGSLNDNNNL